MKIHNKASLFGGLSFFVTCFIFWILGHLDVMEKEPVFDGIYFAMLLFTGMVHLLKSFSEEDELEKADERSQMIQRMAKAKAYSLLMWANCLAFALFFVSYMVQGILRNYAGYLEVFRIVLLSLLCFTAFYNLMVMGAKLYYEKRM